MLGLPLIPPYTEAADGDRWRYGVNYASAAAGILDITGRNFVSPWFFFLYYIYIYLHKSSIYIIDLRSGNVCGCFIDFCSFFFLSKVGRIPFNQQIQNFEATLDQITRNLRAPDVAQALSRSIFFVGMGSNDYLNNYLMPNYNTKNQYNPQQFADLLAQQYAQQLTVRILQNIINFSYLFQIFFRTRFDLNFFLFCPNFFLLDSEAVQSRSKEIRNWRAWIDGLHSEHPCPKWCWDLLWTSEPIGSSLYDQHKGNDQQSQRQSPGF